MPVTSHLTTTTRPHSASSAGNIKGQLRCIFSRSRPTTPVLRNGRKYRNSAQAQAHQVEYNKVQKAKRKKSTQLGHEEEERVMRILHNLEKVQRRKTPAGIREELTDLYIKPLPEYIQDKLKQHEERQMSRSAILFEELFENHSLEDNENSTSADKIQLPEQKPQTTSRWQQKMLNKLEKMENTSTHNSTLSNTNCNTNSTVLSKPPFQPPHLNRSLQVQGQSSCCSKLQTTSLNSAPSSRYKPPVPTSTSLVVPTPPTKPKPTSFSYTDPLPYPTTYLHSKEALSPFEGRILELEKLERDSILIERTSKPRASNREVTTRIPATLVKQPKYLDSTAAFSSRVSQRKCNSGTGTSNGGKNGRSLTPTNINGKLSDSKRKTIREKETILQQKRKSGNSKMSIAARS
ncbi:uncharacterized protein LOC134812975 isoform X1 [Bolinopsis microptera]|uniref:uncharacterized protein LOC134812975 isoform X1 n=1 Tax=Bolinopsis microptera TaxID=2820187 RepID=UPI003078E7C5